MKQPHEILELISRLRNRNVAQLLDDLGEISPCFERSIKRQFTRFATDLSQEIQDEQETRDAAGNC